MAEIVNETNLSERCKSRRKSRTTRRSGNLLFDVTKRWRDKFKSTSRHAHLFHVASAISSSLRRRNVALRVVMSFADILTYLVSYIKCVCECRCTRERATERERERQRKRDVNLHMYNSQRLRVDTRERCERNSICDLRSKRGLFVKEDLYIRMQESRYIFINIRDVFMNHATKGNLLDQDFKTHSLSLSLSHSLPISLGRPGETIFKISAFKRAV